MLLRLHDHDHAIAINAKFANQALQISRAWERGYFVDTCTRLMIITPRIPTLRSPRAIQISIGSPLKLALQLVAWNALISCTHA
jgi:hypothetical protein